MATLVSDTKTITPVRPVLPLEPGDHLTRDEFERRYAAMPNLKKAELVEGVVFVSSAVRYWHGSSHAAMVAWLGYYAADTPGVLVCDNATVRLDLDNEPQPDALMMIEPARGGQARFDSDGYISGAPELVAEVGASSSSIDLNTKLRVYRRNGVLEYIVWRVLEGAIDWFVLKESQYERLTLSTEGWYQSRVFPGLCLDPAALVRSDLRTVLNVLQQSLAGAENAEFVARLKNAGAGPDTGG